MNRALQRRLVVALLLLLSAAGCSVSTAAVTNTATELTERPELVPSTVVDVDATPTPEIAPSATPVPEPAAEPTPELPATPVPTATPVPQGAVLVQGDDWAIVESEFDELIAFVEEVHELEFRGSVTMRTDPDIGANFAIGFEPVTPQDWILFRAFQLTGEPDRVAVNQARLDRIRGVCCEFNDRSTVVVVEVGPTKLETETILVHELVHALHTQHPEFYEGFSPDTSESPFPYAAAIEGVPDFVARAYFATGSPTEQQEVLPNLPIIRDDMIPLTGVGAAKHLNFGYSTGGAFVDAIVDELGTSALSSIIGSMPTTSEQVLFPDRYLAGETAVEVTAPVVPEGQAVLSQGRLGVAQLVFAIGGEVDSAEALELVKGWAGDAYVTYEQDDAVCLIAMILMDEDAQATDLASELNRRLRLDETTAVAQVDGSTISLATCGF